MHGVSNNVPDGAYEPYGHISSLGEACVAKLEARHANIRGKTDCCVPVASRGARAQAPN
jgi:hypothetical protein